MIGYEPTGEVSSATVEHVMVPVRSVSSSPFTNPVVVCVSVGFAAPYVLDWLSAVTVNVAAVTVSVPST